MKAETKVTHTPGPWRVRNNKGTVEGPDGRAICLSNWTIKRITQEHFDYETTDANARLIAAAPDSNAANRHALMAFKSMRGLDAQNQSIADAAISVLDAAIRKATDGDE